MTALPEAFKYGMITGRIIEAVSDTTRDVDPYPDAQVIPGVSITFTPNVPRLTTVDDNDEPILVIPRPKVARLNNQGYIVNIDGSLGFYLLATDNEDVSPVDWQYTVSYQGVVIPSHPLSVPSGSVQAIGDHVPVVSTPPFTTVVTSEDRHAVQVMRNEVISIYGDLVTGGFIDGDNLILVTNSDEEIDAGNVRGPEGPQGPQGIQGEVGPPGIQGIQGVQGERGLPGMLESQATNLVTNPRGRNTSGTVTIFENEALSPIGPTATDTGEWLSNSINTHSFVTDDGEPAIENVLDSSNAVVLWNPGIGIDQGTWIAFAVEYKALHETTRVNRIIFAASGASTDGIYTQPEQDIGVWQRQVAVHQMTEAMSVQARIWPSNNATVGRAYRIRRAVIATGSSEAEVLAAVEDFHDGDTWDGDADFTPQWAGTPHASPSRLVAPSPVGWTGSGGPIYHSQSRDCLAIQVTGGTLVANMNLGNRQGQEITVLSEVDSTIPMVVRNYYGTGPIADPVTVNGPTSIRNVLIPTATSALLRGVHIVGSTANQYIGEKIYFRVLLAEGEYERDYFDGDISRVDSYVYDSHWNGTPHNSTSTATVLYEPEYWGPGLRVVRHGDNAEAPRPFGADVVYWIGSADPINREAGDLWL